MTDFEYNYEPRIKIGEFDSKIFFHYFVMCSLNKSLTEQGRIIERYLKDENFIIIPRETVVEEDIVYRSSLVLFWSTEEITSINSIQELLYGENSEIQSVYGWLIANNGKNCYEILTYGRLRGADSGGRYSYLLTHKHTNGKYIYTLFCGESLKGTFKNITDPETTVLDLSFTGKRSNMYNNCYSFNNYKIKDYYKNDNVIIVSDVKGVIDLESLKNVMSTGMPTGGVTVLNILPGWKNPLVSNPAYFEGISIDIIGFIPENKVDLENQNILSQVAKEHKLILTDNIEDLVKEVELRRQIGFNAALKYIRDKNIPWENIIKCFEKRRFEIGLKQAKREKIDLLNYLKQARNQLKETQAKIHTLEYQTQTFIPMPKIILPSNPHEADLDLIDIESLLKMENNEYVIREE